MILIVRKSVYYIVLWTGIKESCRRKVGLSFNHFSASGVVMSRFLPVSNGRLFVSFDEAHLISELTWPFVGLENHAGGNACRMGVFFAKKFIWINPSHVTRRRYRSSAMVSEVLLNIPELGGMEAVLTDWVDLDMDVYFRRVEVTRSPDPSESVSLFFHQNFSISHQDIGDTAMFVPSQNALLHYKDKRYFLVGGLFEGPGRTVDPALHEFACGSRHGIREGTWRDAEDGRLGGNPIAQGTVDSVFSVLISPERLGSPVTVATVCGESQSDVFATYARVKRRTPERSLAQTAGFWKLWSGSHPLTSEAIPPEWLRLYETSLFLIRTHMGETGSIVAAIDSVSLNYSRDTYSYLWPRDGALIAHALDRAGFGDLSRRFYELLPRLISEEGFLAHKYHPNLSIGSSWHPSGVDGTPAYPIQEDETALCVWALWEHFKSYRDIDSIRPIVQKFVLPAGRFMAKFRDPQTGLPLPSYDLWEERGGISTHTAATVYGGLVAAAQFAKGFGEPSEARYFDQSALEVKEAILKNLFNRETGYFYRGLILSRDGTLIPDPTPDASMYALFEYEVLPLQDIRLIRTMDWLYQSLWTQGSVGGVARYRNDSYYRESERDPSNPWVISTLWMARWFIRTTPTPMDSPQVMNLLSWVFERGGISGMLPEQVHPSTGDRLSVSPLVWSHAEWVLTLSELDRIAHLRPHPWDGPESASSRW